MPTLALGCLRIILIVGTPPLALTRSVLLFLLRLTSALALLILLRLAARLALASTLLLLILLLFSVLLPA